MEYKAVEARELEDLEREVRRLIERGWRPLGGICAVPASGASGGVWSFVQAMIRTSPE